MGLITWLKKTLSGDPDISVASSWRGRREQGAAQVKPAVVSWRDSRYHLLLLSRLSGKEIKTFLSGRDY